jgi:hypothetical protein
MRTVLLPLFAAVLLALSGTPTLASTKNPDLMNAPRPLLFNQLVAFDTDKHRQLRLPQERKSFAFAAQATLLPITFAEVAPALRHYPLVFVAEGSSVALVALTGLGGDKSGGNRFVDVNGEWRAGAYIPAYVRGYPFISVQVSEQAEPVLALDPQAADFKAPGGQPLLLADGAPSEQLKGIMAFQGEYRQLAQRTHTMVQALKDAGVLEEGSLQLQATAGGEPQKIGGFLVVSEAKLKALSADALKKLMDADALGLAYAQMFSMGSLGNLFAQPASAPQTTAQDAKAVQPVVKKSKKKAE